ncbi:MAG: hypothetical protein JNL83_05940 [Myxococcales bacterium]|nr:hypothetical protein [Myxococcales bacterium]
MMRTVWWALLGLAACGDNAVPAPSFERVGHADLGARGMGSALAIAGDVAYVGSRDDRRGIAIVDIADPAAPAMVGEFAMPPAGISSRELRAVPDKNLLIVMNLQCSDALHGCTTGALPVEHLAFYDITDRRQPRVLSTYPIATGRFMPRSPHEMYVRVDGERVRVFMSTPAAKPQLEVVDATNPAAPVRAAAWDPRDGGVLTNGADDILHSVSLSADGRTAYLSHQVSGLLLADVSALPAVTLITPPAKAVTWEPITSMGPHSAVEVPGRDLLVVSEEIYPMPFGGGCPWGPLRTVDMSDRAAPVVAGILRLPENHPDYCAEPRERIAFTAHNATVTHDLALVTWYAGGLVAVDLSDAARPALLAQYLPEPLAQVAAEDPGLGGSPVEMWSYPVIQDGLIYVVDVRNGLYVLRYDGPWSEQIRSEAFLEGNSNL